MIDRIQRRFLRFVGLSEQDAFMKHNIGPLSLRRSIAMLGFIYRCVRGQAPKPCCSLFTLDVHRNPALRSQKVTAAGGKPSTWVTAGGTRRAEFDQISFFKYQILIF